MNTLDQEKPLLKTAARENRLLRYCVAGAGATMVAGTVATTDASVTFINYGGQVINDPAPGDGYFGLIPFDLNQDGTFDFQFGVAQGEANGGAAAIFGPTTGTVGITGFYASGYSYANKLANGAQIGPAQTFVTLAAGSGRADMAFGPGYANSQWLSPTVGFLGVRFTIGGQTKFGYIRMSVGANRAITLFDGAFETNGTAIAAGAVPEPSTTALGIVALGALGLMAHRRRRAAQATA